MTKAIQAIIMVLAVGVVCQSAVHAEELGQPVRFSVSATAQMTDNRDAAAVNEQDNVDIYVRPRLDLVRDGENSRLDLYYVPAYRYRSEPGDDQDESTWQHDFGAKATRSISPRTRVRLNEIFALTDDPAIEEGGITRRGDQSYIQNILDGGLNYDLLKSSNLDISLQNRIKRYDEEAVAVRSDEDATTARVDHRHQINRTLRSLVSVGYSMFAYDGGSNLERDFSSVVGSVGVENYFSVNTIGSLAVGWQTRDYDDEALDADGAPYARAALEGLLGADTKVGGVVGHGVRDSDAYPFVSQEFTDVRAFAEAKLSPKVNLRVSATYRVSTYDEDDVPSGTTAADFTSKALAHMATGATSGDETTIVGDVELSVALSERSALTLGQRYEDIDSDVGQSFTKNTTRAGASFSF
jgi:hypothetical protein